MAKTSSGPDQKNKKKAVAADSAAFRISTETSRRIGEIVKRMELNAGRGGIYIISLPSIDHAPRLWGEITRRLNAAWDCTLADLSSTLDVLGASSDLHQTAHKGPWVLGIIPPDPDRKKERKKLLIGLNIRRENVFERGVSLLLFLDLTLEKDLPTLAKDFFSMRSGFLLMGAETLAQAVGKPSKSIAR